VRPEAITLLCPPSSSAQEWLNQLPTDWQDVRTEVHDPNDRRQLSYLATTRKGRRIYLNRNAVDADQLIILAQRGYDPLLGYSGAAGALYPALSDEATRKEMCGRLSLTPPGDKVWPVREEAREVAWLLGAPFMVQVIEGTGEEIAYVVCGLADTSKEGEALLNARWRLVVERPADVVVASVSGDPARHQLADLARALACAARVVKPHGRIVLLSRSQPGLGPGVGLIRQTETPDLALELLRAKAPPDMAAAFLWARAAQRASLYLLTALPDETVEELFATPMQHAGQVQRLIGPEDTCLFIADAHKSLAVAEAATSE
jgi:nickel-dependent lactate racemase